MRATTKKPIVAIGGIDLERAALAIEHGADGVAVVSAILGGRRSRCRGERAMRATIDASLARRGRLR